MKISIPHIHKIEGEMGFWAKVAKTGKIEELKLQTLIGLRQIEGIVIGRRAQEVPLIISRICGICPIVHRLNACCALEKALNIKFSPLTTVLRKILLANQIIHSHTLHLFFMSLADFFNFDHDLDLLKKFPKETKAALQIRDFSLKMVKLIGGRVVHPVTVTVGGFLKYPQKQAVKKLLDGFGPAMEASEKILKLLTKLDYEDLKRETTFVSVYFPKEYAFYKEKEVMAGGKLFSAGDFYSNEIEEKLKLPPVKRVSFKGKPYMLGAISRVKNSHQFLHPRARKIFEDFKKQRKNIFQSTFYNLFYQGLEVLHFLEETEKLIKDSLKYNFKETIKPIKTKRGSGLSAMEAPRGTLFTYFELDKNGRVYNCNIITPSAQFLNNMEADLKKYLPQIIKLKPKQRIKKVRALIRVYDPCISCATH